MSSSDDKSIRVFDIKVPQIDSAINAIINRCVFCVQEDRCIRTIGDAQGHFVTTVCMSNRHPVVISGSVDKIVCVWECN